MIGAPLQPKVLPVGRAKRREIATESGHRSDPRLRSLHFGGHEIDEARLVQRVEQIIDVNALPFFLTAGEAAALLRTTKGAVYARAARGLLPGAIRDGRRLLIRRDDLLKSLEERRAASPGST